jgi:hypothetical protein
MTVGSTFAQAHAFDVANRTRQGFVKLFLNETRDRGPGQEILYGAVLRKGDTMRFHLPHPGNWTIIAVQRDGDIYAVEGRIGPRNHHIAITMRDKVKDGDHRYDRYHGHRGR